MPERSCAECPHRLSRPSCSHCSISCRRPYCCSKTVQRRNREKLNSLFARRHEAIDAGNERLISSLTPAAARERSRGTAKILANRDTSAIWLRAARPPTEVDHREYVAGPHIAATESSLRGDSGCFEYTRMRARTSLSGRRARLGLLARKPHRSPGNVLGSTRTRRDR